ncbi:MarR family winged helix-turn-helix transcriptional regulator [Paenibacillus sp. DYY-L-2]|uniref:MarR family winged helix-turn-helix transcriptional regulator n=1 Tax=Paenibacillus sp. DYY-L-2 TaxID=3447013 RepID=UPI003F4FF0EF
MKNILNPVEPEYVMDAIKAFEQMMVGNDFSVLAKIARVSQGENFVLKILLRSERPVSPTYLSETMNTTKGRISSILKTLEKKGAIEREIDKENRRNILVTITDAGKEHIMSEMDSVYNMMVGAFKSLGEEETKEVVRLIQKLVSAMTENDN